MLIADLEGKMIVHRPVVLILKANLVGRKRVKKNFDGENCLNEREFE